MPDSPFTDRKMLSSLYASTSRLELRCSTLRSAKVEGEDVTAEIGLMAKRISVPRPIACDIGCGRGSTTLELGRRLSPRRLFALDLSAPLLAAVRQRANAADILVETIEADFHQIPLGDGTLDLASAAFCLYHSTTPAFVVSEIARCLNPSTGRAIFVTKSSDSYGEIDEIVTRSGLDEHAKERMSLYETFSGTNARDIVSTKMSIIETRDSTHVFEFATAELLAEYIVTTPKYCIPEEWASRRSIADCLRDSFGSQRPTATSTVTYIIAESL